MSDGKQERPERTTLVLSSEVNAWLDGQALAMRKKTGTYMSRSMLLRSIVKATAELAQANFEDCRTEEEIGMVMFCGGLSGSDTTQGAG